MASHQTAICEHVLLPRFYTQYGRFFIAGLSNDFADDKHPGAYLLHVKKITYLLKYSFFVPLLFIGHTETITQT